MRAYPKGGGARATLQRHDPQGLLTTDEAVDETRIRALFFGDRSYVYETGKTTTYLHPESRARGCTQGDTGVSSLKIVSRISGILMNTHLHHTWVRVLADMHASARSASGLSSMRCADAA